MLLIVLNLLVVVVVLIQYLLLTMMHWVYAHMYDKWGHLVDVGGYDDYYYHSHY